MTKKNKVHLEHRAFGWGSVIGAHFTLDDNPVLEVRFDGGRERTVLASPEYWLSPAPELEAAFDKFKDAKPAVRKAPKAKIDPDEVQEVTCGNLAILCGDDVDGDLGNCFDPNRDPEPDETADVFPLSGVLDQE